MAGVAPVGLGAPLRAAARAGLGGLGEKDTPIGDPLKGHDGWVSAVAVGELDGRPVIVSGGSDRTVRVRELAERQELVIAVGSEVQAVALDERGRTVMGARAGVMLLEPVRPWIAATSTRPPVS
jgi:hypothetical protein